MGSLCRAEAWPAHNYVDPLYGGAPVVLGSAPQWEDASLGFRALVRVHLPIENRSLLVRYSDASAPAREIEHVRARSLFPIGNAGLGRNAIKVVRSTTRPKLEDLSAPSIDFTSHQELTNTPQLSDFLMRAWMICVASING